MRVSLFFRQTEPIGCMYRFMYIRNWIMWIWRQVPWSARWIIDWGPRKTNGFFLVCVWRPENQENWCRNSYLKANRLKTQEKPMFQFKFEVKMWRDGFLRDMCQMGEGNQSPQSQPSPKKTLGEGLGCANLHKTAACIWGWQWKGDQSRFLSTSQEAKSSK